MGLAARQDAAWIPAAPSHLPLPVPGACPWHQNGKDTVCSSVPHAERGFGKDGANTEKRE